MSRAAVLMRSQPGCLLAMQRGNIFHSVGMRFATDARAADVLQVLACDLFIGRRPIGLHTTLPVIPHVSRWCSRVASGLALIALAAAGMSGAGTAAAAHGRVLII